MSCHFSSSACVAANFLRTFSWAYFPSTSRSGGVEEFTAAKIAAAISALNGVHKGVTVNIGRIRGGDAVNVVPDLCVMRVNVRVTNTEEQLWIEEEMRRIQQEWDRPDQGFRV